MERLTFTDEEMERIETDCPVKNDYLTDRFCDNVCDEFQHNCPFMKMAQRLKAYEDKQEQGLLIELPVAIGTEVYKVVEDKTAATIETIKHNGNEYYRTIPCYFVCRDLFDFSMIKDVGKTIFLTYPEAKEREKALELLAKSGGKHEIM